MNINLSVFLRDWPHTFIHDSDLAYFLGKSDDARYGIVKRALKQGSLIRLRKGLYLIADKARQVLPNEFELALQIYGPSVISLESALSFHGWIPEAVYTTTCVTPKRAQEFENKFGVFSYTRVPEQGFYRGVDRIAAGTSVAFIAAPWKALADFIYTRHKTWRNLQELEADLRIDHEAFLSGDKALLQELCEYYSSPRVRKILKRFLIEINKKDGELL
jgi:predicted transcriptional regulator of viral defense system